MSAINEKMARLAKSMNSMYDYEEGSATAQYDDMVNSAKEIAENKKKEVDAIYHEKIDGLFTLYCRKLAENLNKHYEIETRVPSIVVSGGGNFPVSKKEKQNKARDKNMEEYNKIQSILQKIKSMGNNGISADAPDILDKLNIKLERLKISQEHMKSVNAYYRKNKKIDDCPLCSDEEIEKIKGDEKHEWWCGAPYASYTLSNNNAKIKSVESRIAGIKNKSNFIGWIFDGGEVKVNDKINRLQILFDEKPNEEKRAILKRNGFKWSSKQCAWQRQLTSNAMFTAKHYIDFVNN